MLGTPATLASIATACRSARAAALNAASMMWWLFSPANERTWRVIASVGGQRDEELLGKRGVEGADDLDGQLDGVVQLAAARDVDRAENQRLVHRHDRGAEPRHARLVAESLARWPGPARCRRLRPCDARRPRGHLSPSPRDRTVRGARTRRACGRRTAPRWRRRSCPHPSRSRLRRRSSVSPVLRVDLCPAAHGGLRPSGLGRHVVTARPRLLAEVLRSPSAREHLVASPAKNRSFSSAVPTVTRRQSSSPGVREKSRTSTEWPCSRSRHSARGVLNAEQHEVGLGREDLHAVDHRQAVAEAVATAHDVTDLLLEDHALPKDHAPPPTGRTRRPSTAGAPSSARGTTSSWPSR